MKILIKQNLIVSLLLLSSGLADQANLNIQLDTKAIERTSGNSYAPMIQKTKPSVVSVYTAEVVKTAQRSGGSMEDLLLRRFFGEPVPNRNMPPSSVKEEKIPQGVGSGVIISRDGYILTNNHVVADKRGGNADEILVRLSDDTELEAKLIGRDPKTDIAVIKVDAKNLPALPIADSNKIKVGDTVFALGNPLGIGMTVTSGIISATNRSIGIYGNEGYEDFIQTDAPINQGNSGGALIDIEGRLIGINSAIVSRTGGSVGLGFAIPTNLSIGIAEQLVSSGEVKRGLIGIRMSLLEDSVAEAMGVSGQEGVLIEQVEEGFPADKAGLKHGDIVIEIDGKSIATPREIRLAVAQTPPGEKLKVVALRNGNKKSFTVKVADPETLRTLSDELISGVNVSAINNQLRQKYAIPLSLTGLVVTEVSPNSPFRSVFSEGVVILEINRNNFDDLKNARELIRKDNQNLFYLYKNGITTHIAIKL